MYASTVSFYNILQIFPHPYNKCTKIYGHRQYTCFTEYCFGKSTATHKMSFKCQFYKNQYWTFLFPAKNVVELQFSF